MKAAITTAYGKPQVIEIQDVPKPQIKDNQVLVKVRTSSVSTGDARIRGLNVPLLLKPIVRMVFGIKKPRQLILGISFAGDIVEVGSHVQNFKVGDAVFGSRESGMGAHAEYMAVRADGELVLKPSHLDYKSAVGISFGDGTAKYFLEKAKIAKDQHVLIYGASGSVGTSAIQLAKHLGARVTAVCSASNIELVRALGADHVIDYTQTNFLENHETYDVIFDTLGKTDVSECLQSLSQEGVFISSVFMGIKENLIGLWTNITSSKRVFGGTFAIQKADLEYFIPLYLNHDMQAVIDSEFSLTDIVKAHERVETGHKVGDVIINIYR